MAKKSADTSNVSVLDRVINDQALLQEAAIEVLKRAATGQPLEPAHFSVMQGVGIDNKFELQRRIDEVRNLLGWQATAGTREERALIASTLDEARAKRDSELPGIKQRLEELVREVQETADALNRPVEELERKVNVMNHALGILRNPEKLPEHIRHRYQAMHDQAHERFRPLIDAKSQEINLTGRLALLEQVAPRAGKYNVDVPNDQRDFISRERIWEEGHHPTPCARKCAELKETLETKLRAARAIIKRDQAAFDEAMAEARELLEYWVL